MRLANRLFAVKFSRELERKEAPFGWRGGGFPMNSLENLAANHVLLILFSCPSFASCRFTVTRKK